MKKLLVCIAFHYNPELDRFKYLMGVIGNFIYNYKDFDINIIIDTNTPINFYEIFSRPDSIVRHIAHPNLAHPFHLTWMHRKHIKDNIDNYDYFMYCEDDMLVPYENFLNYIETFERLWPLYVPGFIRVEEFEGVQYCSDVTQQHKCIPYKFGNRQFFALPYLENYHAFWIMPQKQLKETIKPDFVKVTDGREFAAMYTGWELGKPCLVEIENGQVSPKCYSYHLPNNYANSRKLIKVNEIFI